uniref:Uncharacterized protein n=1 Tax=Molossus molossus TaxID=27622 RepID=A0A7J8HH80_MOLMO|nr:hypothetical protein HJG59_011071 [Molossus molossus]
MQRVILPASEKFYTRVTFLATSRLHEGGPRPKPRSAEFSRSPSSENPRSVLGRGVRVRACTRLGRWCAEGEPRTCCPPSAGECARHAGTRGRPGVHSFCWRPVKSMKFLFLGGKEKQPSIRDSALILAAKIEGKESSLFSRDQTYSFKKTATPNKTLPAACSDCSFSDRIGAVSLRNEKSPPRPQ